MTRWCSLALLLLVGLSTAACDDRIEPAESPTAVPWSEITYRLAWDPIEVDENNRWRTTSNLGYEVEITEGLVVSRTLTLEPCPLADALPGQQSLALHEETPDPSTLPGAFIESITPPSDRTFPPITIAPTQYCRLSYRASRAISTTDGIETYPEMDQKTLSIHGQWRRETTSEWQALKVETQFAFWHTKPLPLAGGDSAVTITLYRQLDKLFDDVDLATSTKRKIESRVTENLVRHARVEVHGTDPSASAN